MLLGIIRIVDGVPKILKVFWMFKIFGFLVKYKWNFKEFTDFFWKNLQNLDTSAVLEYLGFLRICRIFEGFRIFWE
jgi:hypothetical protein